MRVDSFLIARGNPTALVWDCNEAVHARVSSLLMQEGRYEQVGFVDVRTKSATLTMMGNELCVNAILALASHFQCGDTLRTSGMSSPIQVMSGGRTPRVVLPLFYEVFGTVVLFEGIGFVCIDHAVSCESDMLRDYALQYSRPAFGVIQYGNEQDPIIPTVYVHQTRSCVVETACGSGSIALSILTGRRQIIQPTQSVLSIDQTGDGFVVSGLVETLSTNDRTF